MKRKLVSLSLVVSLGLLLAACGNSKSKQMTTLSNGSNNTYRTVVVNGKYLVSKSRGVNLDNGNSITSLKSFDSGLMNVAKQEFAPKTYIFQEGQYLSSHTINQWLARKSEKHPQGLNPAKESKDNPNPEYLQQIEEQDFMTQSGNQLSLRGMVIGIAVNSQYQYQKKADGPTYTKDIESSEAQAAGKAAAAKILQRLRQKKATQRIPIVFAIYQQAGDESLVGGNFVAYTRAEGNQIQHWKELDYQTKLLPEVETTTTKTDKKDDDTKNFTNFRDRIQNFFPNLSGVTAQAQYYNGNLSGMNVTISTQFYSESEIQSFTQYVERQAKKYLPSGVPIEIKIQTTDNDVQAVVYRDGNSDNYNRHVFSAY